MVKKKKSHEYFIEHYIITLLLRWRRDVSVAYLGFNFGVGHEIRIDFILYNFMLIMMIIIVNHYENIYMVRPAVLSRDDIKYPRGKKQQEN